MFETLRNLVDQLAQYEEGIASNQYPSCRDARKILQSIKVEALLQRKTVSDGFKKSRAK